MPATYQCDGCGQADADPKLHYGSDTYHHDCVPFYVYRDLTTVGTFENGRYVETPGVEMSDEAAAFAASFIATVEACKGGLKGDKLRAHITKES